MEKDTCFQPTVKSSILPNKTHATESTEGYLFSGRSLSTFFRMFVGQGWTSVMYASSNATTEAARILFISFMLILSYMIANLLIGYADD